MKSCDEKYYGKNIDACEDCAEYGNECSGDKPRLSRQEEVPTIVHCEECVYFCANTPNPHFEGDTYESCGKFHGMVVRDGYCSWAKRRRSE